MRWVWFSRVWPAAEVDCTLLALPVSWMGTKFEF